MNLFILAFNAKRDEFKIFSEDEWIALPEDDVEWDAVCEGFSREELILFLNQFILNMTVTEKN